MTNDEKKKASGKDGAAFVGLFDKFAEAEDIVAAGSPFVLGRA